MPSSFRMHRHLDGALRRLATHGLPALPVAARPCMAPNHQPKANLPRQQEKILPRVGVPGTCRQISPRPPVSGPENRAATDQGPIRARNTPSLFPCCLAPSGVGASGRLWARPNGTREIKTRAGNKAGKRVRPHPSPPKPPGLATGRAYQISSPRRTRAALATGSRSTIQSRIVFPADNQTTTHGPCTAAVEERGGAKGTRNAARQELGVKTREGECESIPRQR